MAQLGGNIWLVAKICFAWRQIANWRPYVHFNIALDIFYTSLPVTCPRAPLSSYILKGTEIAVMEKTKSHRDSTSYVVCTFLRRMLLNQYSPVPRARSSTAGKDATRQR